MARNRGANQGPPSTQKGSIKGGIKSRLRYTWIGKNWHTIVILAAILVIALFVRAYFAYSISVDNGYLVSGGSDSYYHQRVIEYVMNNGQHLVFDPMLDYPDGMRNPRPPLYDWSVAVSASFLSGIGISDASDAMGFTLVLSTAFWGILTIIPIYLMGRAAFGNKAGLIAAFLFALMAGHIQRSVMSNADHDAMVLFFAVCSFYFLMLALMKVKGDRWVSSWRSPGAVRGGLVDFTKRNQIALLYAVLSGTMLAAVAMIWTGYPYVMIIILAYLLVQVLVNRFRDTDTMGSVFIVGAVLLTAFALIAPLYWQMNYWGTWFDIPFYLFLAGMVFGLYFVVTRDLPWTLVIPIFIVVAGIALFILSFTMPALFEAIITGQGYFVQSKLYSTISEAQPPDFSNLVLSFGMVTFWLSFAGVVYAAMKVMRETSPYLIFIVVWSGVSMFMAISAGRFLFNAAPAFAITAGWIVAVIIDRIHFQEIPKSLSGMRGNFLTSLRKSIKLGHVLGVVFLAMLILLPNVWFAVDAGIPSNSKEEYSQQVYDIMPDFLKPADYDSVNGTSWYFGAFTYTLPLPTSYWPRAWDWYSQQDSDIYPEVDRPAFLSWWDYGFEAIQLGRHPTVADNFQNAYQFAGQFITCQSEDYAIAMMITRTLEQTGVSSNQSIVLLLERYGVDVDLVNDIMTDPSSYIRVVLDNPDIYGPYASDLSSQNAKYAAMQVALGQIGTDDLVGLYHDLREETGIEIGYFAIDGRLFPFTAFGYNIFYAPATLSDHRIDQFNQPFDFYQIMAVDQYGETHTFENVTQDMVIVDYTIEYKPMFYNCMLYRNFMGYGPYDIGYTTQGIPGISGSLANLPPMQGWNLTHFRMVYRTAYFNPFPEEQVADHPEAWQAVSWDEALVLREKIEAGEIYGVVDMSPPTLASGVVFIQYYEGAIIEGTATTESGQPFANAWVTILDEYGIPHHTVKTDENGHYSAIMPFGNVSVVYSYGDLDLRTQIGAAELKTVTYNISYSQAMREEVDEDKNGIWDFYIDGDVEIAASDISGRVFWDMNGDGKYDPTRDQPITDADVVLDGVTVEFLEEVPVDSGGLYLFPSIPPMTAQIYAYIDDRRLGLSTQVIYPLGDFTVDIPVEPCGINGTLVLENGVRLEGLVVELTDLASGDVLEQTSDQEGRFQFSKLLPGNYTVSLQDQTLSIGEQVFNLNNGFIVDKSFTVYDSMKISGSVRVDGTLTSNVMIRVMSDTTEMWITSDSSGRYSLMAPRGEYDIYALYVKKGVEYASLAKAKAGDQTTVNLNLLPGEIVTGTVYQGGVPIEDTRLVFKSRITGASVSVVSNDLGWFRIVLPADAYFIHASTGTHAIWQDVYIQASKKLDVYLTGAAVLSGTVWTDSDGNGLMGVTEVMDGVPISVTDPDGREVLYTTDMDGKYQLVLVPGNTYQVQFSYPGYKAVVRDYEPLTQSIKEDVQLVPQNRTLDGSTFFGVTPLSGIEVRFMAAGGGAIDASAVSDVHGEFTLSLFPGYYLVEVDQNVSTGSNATRWQNTTTIQIMVGQDPDPLDLEVVKRVRVYGNIAPDRGVNTQLTFDGPEKVEVTVDHAFDLYLIPGEYNIYALDRLPGGRYASLERVILDQYSSPLVITTETTRAIEGSLVFDGEPFLDPIPVSIVSDTGAVLSVQSNTRGTFSAYVPLGQYTIEVDHPTIEIVDKEKRYVRYLAIKEVEVTQTIAVDVWLSREYDNSTVSGTLIGTNGDPVAGQVTFTAASETAMDASLTATAAGFTLEMAPGTYTVYAKQLSGTGVFLGKVEIEPYQPADLLVQLETGLKFSGETVYGGASGPAFLTISGNGTIDLASDITGAFEVYLPKGEYNVSCNATTTEKGMKVEYTSSFDLLLESSTRQTISLEKSLVLGVTVKWNEQEKATINPGEQAIYTITLLNTGNVKDTYRLEALYTSWDIEFSQESVTIDFGTQNSAVVTVYITTPEDAKVEHSEIRIRAQSTISSQKSGSVNIDVNILPVRSVGVSFDKGYATEGNNYSFSIKLENQGNVDDTYLLTVANAKQLESLGWTYRFADSNGSSMEITVEAGKPAYFDMFMIPDRANPDPDVELVLSVKSTTEGTVQEALPVVLNLPLVTIPDLLVTGTTVHDSAPVIPLGTVALGGVALIMFVIVVLLGLQKGVFRRRRR